MQKNLFLSRKHATNAFYVLSIVTGTALTSMISTNAYSAAGFETSNDFTAATCPSGNKMYYVGFNPPNFTPIVTQPLSWTSGSTSNSFTFNETSGNKVFNLNFNILLDLNSNFTATPPTFGTLAGVTENAINLVHNSPVSASPRTNNALQTSVNRPTTKMGYKIQDIDSTGVAGSIPYIEQINVAQNSGRLTFNSIFHTINTNQNIVTAISGQNCGAGVCNIDALWNYNNTNSVVNLSHINTQSQRDSAHGMGYSDFYFCLAPPKVIVKKALTANRVNDTTANRDQFAISVNNAATVVNTFTTTGTGAAVTNNSGAVALAENTSYTITERITNSLNNGDIINYNASYVCNNETTGSTTVVPTGAMTYNATAKTRSFTLANVTFGDEINCTITNTPLTYTFSGTVFDDNGGITSPDAEQPIFTSGTYNNTNYFNGVFNTPSESGISGSTVSLVSCADTSISYATQAVGTSGATIGQYQFSVPLTTFGTNRSICLVESRTGTTYPIRTTTDTINTGFATTTYSYPNNNFGRVISANAALVLRKFQFINACPTALNYSGTATTADPRTGFSTDSINGNITPGQCIAYKITATNRANVPINNFIMQDKLQSRSDGAAVTSVLANPVASTTDYASDSVPIGQNGTVKTNTFTLTPRSNRDFYFNTKYGTVSGAP